MKYGVTIFPGAMIKEIVESVAKKEDVSASEIYREAIKVIIREGKLKQLVEEIKASHDLKEKGA